MGRSHFRKEGVCRAYRRRLRGWREADDLAAGRVGDAKRGAAGDRHPERVVEDGDAAGVVELSGANLALARQSRVGGDTGKGCGIGATVVVPAGRLADHDAVGRTANLLLRATQPEPAVRREGHSAGGNGATIRAAQVDVAEVQLVDGRVGIPEEAGFEVAGCEVVCRHHV